GKRSPREVRKAIVNELRKDGMSTRAVAAALGITQKQVTRASDVTSTDVTYGTDGKTYTRPEPKVHPEDEFKTEYQPPIDEKFFAMAEAERSNELESVRKELAAAKRALAALKRVQALEGELNEIRLAAAMLRARARRGDDVADLADYLVNRIDSVMDKG